MRDDIMPLIRTEALTHIFSKDTPFEKTAIENISLDIQEGQIVGIIGHTGSGKSTFISHLNGLTKPTGGRVLYRGEDINRTKQANRDIRYKVGLVFQYPEYQLFEETVYRDIAFGPRNMKLTEREIDERVRESAQFAGVPTELLDKPPLELSGGEKRRAAIAGVMAMRPEVLILDEPTAGLDPRGRADVIKNIVEYHRRSGSTILLVTHDMEEIARTADRLIVFKDGCVVMDGSPAEIFRRSDDLETMGLTVPTAAQIASRLRRLGVPLSDVFTNDALKAEILSLWKGEYKK